METRACRMLGLNIIDKKIHNTREFKRRLRLVIHHVRWLLEHDGHDQELWKAWKQLQGMA